jgi:hypothetical protein
MDASVPRTCPIAPSHLVMQYTAAYVGLDACS